MRYFGVPTCPYCKKRVNLIRTWRLKREGEYKCPRCGGISNIYLSPLVYVFSVLAICAGICIYFFHKFVLDDIELYTCVYIFIPFAIFYLLSLFTVYLERPVIKRVQRPVERKSVRGQNYATPGEYPEQPTRKKLRPDVNFPDMNSGRYSNGSEQKHNTRQ